MTEEKAAPADQAQEQMLTVRHGEVVIMSTPLDKPMVDDRLLASLPAPQAAAPVDPMVALIERVLLDPRLDVAKLDQLLAMRERYEQVEARKAFVAAMAEFKANPPTIVKDAHVYYPSRDGKPPVDFWHASLGSITQAIGAAMAPHGLAFRWSVEQDTSSNAGGRMVVTCIVSHKGGHEERVSLSGSPDTTGGKNNIQAVGSTVSYLQRYTLVAATGLAAQEISGVPDDDGAGGGDAVLSDADKEVADKINGCKTVPELRDLWTTLEPRDQARHKAVKDAKYRALTMPRSKGGAA